MKVVPLSVANTCSPDVTAAIIAAYNPAPSLVATVKALAMQVTHIVIVDDGSGANATTVLNELEQVGAIIHRQGTNQGIGAALNAGVEVAEKMFHPDYFLTLDQDSILNDNYVIKALETRDAAEAAGVSTGFVAAASYSGHMSPTWRAVNGFVQAFDPMQSGFLIPRATFDVVGPFASDFFIDGVDSDFTMRCRERGLATIIAPDCTIEHDLGDRGKALLLGRPVRFMGREIEFNYHSPSRVYYICRNGTNLSRRYLFREPRWVLRRLLEESKAHLLRFLFSPNRVKLIMAALAGFKDATVKKSGRISPELEKRLN